jgi:hypothetical protein
MRDETFEPEACPDWCTDGPHTASTPTHFGEIHEILLNLHEPRRTQHPLHKAGYWTPVVLEVVMQQEHGALWPIVRIGLEGASEEEILKLTPSDLMDLQTVLTQLTGLLEPQHAA